MKKNKPLLFSIAGLIILITIFFVVVRFNINPTRSTGEVMDSFNGVKVYYNGGVSQTFGRHKSPDGYNLGVRYQCVEFIKRYYYERFSHKMPYTYGHAKDYFDRSLADGQLNTKRDLIQYQNGSVTKPAIEDILILDAWPLNRYGHVAIISKVENDSIEIVQQNSGPFGSSRKIYKLSRVNDRWRIEDDRILGWLHKG